MVQGDQDTVDGKLNPADIGTKDQKVYGKTWFKMLEKIGMGFSISKDQ